MLDAVPGSLKYLICLGLHDTLWGRYGFFHFETEETEAQVRCQSVTVLSGSMDCSCPSRKFRRRLSALEGIGEEAVIQGCQEHFRLWTRFHFSAPFGSWLSSYVGPCVWWWGEEGEALSWIFGSHVSYFHVHQNGPCPGQTHPPPGVCPLPCSDQLTNPLIIWECPKQFSERQWGFDFG